jgi:hypothetical protein
MERVHGPPVVQSIYELGAVASTRKPGGSTAKMAYMKNFDASPEISEERARESGDPPRGTEQDITKTVEAMDEHARKESSGASVSG